MSPDRRPDTIGAALGAAARYVERFGWHPGYLYDDHSGCVRNCACHRTGYYPASILGAVRAALVGRATWFMDTTGPGTPQAYAVCLDHLNAHLMTVGAAGLRGPVLAWQAAPGRTPAQVVAALRAAATTAPPVRIDGFALAPVIRLADRRPAPPPGLFDPATPAA